ncbi:hypothetical protein DV735_g2168, partial [Chaetothyriales sp. CBS 134920]
MASSDSQKASTLVANLKELSAKTHAAADDSEIWAALNQTLSQQFGYQLLTVLKYSSETGATRLHSTNVKLHPLGHRDPVTSESDKGAAPPTPPSRPAWIKKVLVDGETWRGSTREDLKLVFEDWELLWHAGLGSVLNIPVRIHGRTIGSLNVLDKEHAYDDADLAIGILIAQLVAPTIQSAGEKKTAA